MRYATIAVCLGIAACAGGGKSAATARDTTALTQRQRDSVIGASKLPGAQGIQKAQRAQDSLAARAARIDSVQ